MKEEAVPYGAKLLNWKQITTLLHKTSLLCCCSLWSKVTKLKANHNEKDLKNYDDKAVPYGAKLLNWKQITTNSPLITCKPSCSLWSKVTKLKANHNGASARHFNRLAVPYGAKLLNWKQITTRLSISLSLSKLFLMEQSY